MLATTIQITNNPPHTTHTNNTTTASWLRRQPPPTRAADAHTVLNVNPTVCLKAPHHQTAAEKRFMPNPKTHPHPPPHCRGSKHMQAQENNQHTNQTANMLHCSPLNGLPRKEVIQPHLPVRLPCYDFVPIANPTFDHSPRTSRLGHGLRVLPTFVT